MIIERRKIPRYLCSDEFSDSQLIIGSFEFSLISVNFNRFGIGLYSNISLPEINEEDNCLVSFQIDVEPQKMSIKQMPCKIENIRHTDVGHQYGISFAKIKSREKHILELLLQIEKYLEKRNSPENRYGIF